jgi:hypothetical protein
MKPIPLPRNKVAIVDDEDFEKMSKYIWFTSKGRHTYYAIRTNFNPPPKFFRMHREILNAPPNSIVDHINGLGLNNTRDNLRQCTTGENRCNQRKYSDNTSGFKGVTFNKEMKKFRALIRYKRKLYHLGYFKSAREAANVYDKKAKELHGKFARTNF